MAFNQPNYYGYGQYQPNFNPYMNNTAYGTGYNSYQSTPVMSQPVNQPTTLPPQPMGQAPMLYGKVVDGVDVVKAMDVPINQAAVCPKADLSCVFIKSWNADGTTRVSEYKLITEEVSNSGTDLNSILGDIKLSIDALEKKIDRMRNNSNQQNQIKKKRPEDEHDE